MSEKKFDHIVEDPAQELQDVKQRMDEIREEKKKEIDQEIGEKIETELPVIFPAVADKKPGDTALEKASVHDFYLQKQKKLEKSVEALNSLETGDLDKELKDYKERTTEAMKADYTLLLKHYGYITGSLKAAIDAINGGKFQAYRNATDKVGKFFEPGLESGQRPKFREVREHSTHTLLKITSFLDENKPSIGMEGRRGFNGETKEQALNLNHRVEEVQKDLRNRAEKIDVCLRRAEFHINAAKELRKQNDRFESR